MFFLMVRLLVQVTFNCGVPQGSILGPLLFILYINDIAKCSEILRLILFADDTNIFYSNSDTSEIENVVNTELCKLSTWFKANKLSLNATKTNFIIFGYKKVSKHGKKIEIDVGWQCSRTRRLH